MARALTPGSGSSRPVPRAERRCSRSSSRSASCCERPAATSGTRSRTISHARSSGPATDTTPCDPPDGHRHGQTTVRGPAPLRRGREALSAHPPAPVDDTTRRSLQLVRSPRLPDDDCRKARAANVLFRGGRADRNRPLLGEPNRAPTLTKQRDPIRRPSPCRPDRPTPARDGDQPGRTGRGPVRRRPVRRADEAAVADTVIVVAESDAVSSVPVTVVTPPFSEFEVGDRRHVTTGSGTALIGATRRSHAAPAHPGHEAAARRSTRSAGRLRWAGRPPPRIRREHAVATGFAKRSP